MCTHAWIGMPKISSPMLAVIVDMAVYLYIIIFSLTPTQEISTFIVNRAPVTRWR